MNSGKYNKELVEAFVKAAGNAFSSLKETHKEQTNYQMMSFMMLNGIYGLMQ